jgi:Mg2+ and Co2+ transporter CorA
VQLDVSIELITMVAAVAALVAALFGMNLASGVDGIDFVNETERNWSLAIFWIVTALSLLFLVAVPVIGMALMRRYFLSS